jgi:hypothetical protein
MINSRFVAYYIDSFVNSTSHCTTGDAKLIPILIPTMEQLQNIKEIFDKAIIIREKESEYLISEQDAEIQLDNIQEELDFAVNKLYAI